MSQSDPNQSPSEIPLASLVNPDHPLVKLESVLDWDYFEAEFTQSSGETAGRPALHARLLVEALSPTAIAVNTLSAAS